MKIDHASSIPAPTSGKRVYPFADMKVGDSLFAEGEAGMRMSSASLQFAQRHPGWKFTRRTIDGGVRVWRVA